MMMLSPDPKWDWGKILLFAILAFSGGSLGYTMRQLDANEKVSAWRFLLEGLSAVFFAVITGAICIELDVSFGWASAAIGLTSWLGSRATALLVKSLLLKRLGVTTEVQGDAESNSESK